MTRCSRRRFLEDSVLAAAVVAAGPLPLARTLAAEEKSSSSPNEKLLVAVVGVRGRGGEHLQAFANRKDTEVAYIVDADEKVGNQRADAVAKLQKRRPKFVSDMRSAFEDKSLDLVSTATPNHWHSLVAIWAMQAGKDMYVEKPVSHNVNEGRRAVEAARKYNRICQTGTQCRSMRGTIEAMEYIHSGKIGEVKLARGLCYKPRGSIGAKGVYPIPAEVNQDLWFGPAQIKPLTRPKFHYDWHWQWDYGNGDLGNQGIHQMDLSRWALGVDTLSSQVMSYGGRFGYEDAGETANTQVVIHEFGGKTLVFEVRGLKTDPLRDARVGVIVYGSEGCVVLNSYTGGVALDKDGKVVRKFSGDGDHFGNFIQAARSRKMEDLRSDILEGHLSSALCHTGNIAYRLGKQLPFDEAKKQLAAIKTNDDTQETFERFSSHLKANNVDMKAVTLGYGAPLAFDPSSETFPGNEAANAMLTRDYRKPYVVPAAGQV
jgi:predicted dehydrogenase